MILQACTLWGRCKRKNSGAKSFVCQTPPEAKAEPMAGGPPRDRHLFKAQKRLCTIADASASITVRHLSPWHHNCECSKSSVGGRFTQRNPASWPGSSLDRATLLPTYRTASFER